ncbi:hypothetical protein [Brevibacterium pigmentatum]|uniref:hypothetical protein n=1 Tax=Brevibacterium pigmentatum TaxID=1496080 RepID=UPI00141E4D5E|nr:hypothetical protein [Brevibacterium pigmentatum]
MRHDEERPRTSDFLSEATVPGHWTQVLGGMRANAFTRLSLDEVRAEAAHLLILSPSPEVARACFGEMLGEFGDSVEGAVSDAGSKENVPTLEVAGLDDVVPSHVPAGTWVFLPHRQDGWTELEEASARLRRDLVKENSGRAAADKLVLIEYGINLWLWAEPPSSGGDPVCHAGELISWESAWALESGGGDRTVADAGSDVADGAVDSSGTRPPTASARPPIYFGLPPFLRKRRWDS